MTGDLAYREPYTEQVVLLNGQAISFPKPADFIETSNSTDDFGIPHNVTVYKCFQSLYKIQPLFDYVVAHILHGDPNGNIVLQASILKNQTNIVSKRIQSAFIEIFCISRDTMCKAARNVFKRVFFIKRVPSNKVGHLLQRSTVVWHPFPFCGSKSSADAL